jgi:hypothetical protein
MGCISRTGLIRLPQPDIASFLLDHLVGECEHEAYTAVAWIGWHKKGRIRCVADE